MGDNLDERTVGTDRIVEEVGRRFGIGVPDSWADLGGSRTTNLRLCYSDASMVARIHRATTSVERLAAIQAARSEAAKAGIPAIPPMCTPDGETIVRLSGGPLVELETYQPGGLRMNTPPLLRIGFGVLAQLHDALSAADLPEQARYAPYANYLPRDEMLEACTSGADRIHSWDEPRLSEFADRAVEHLEAISQAEEPLRAGQRLQLAHGDFWDNNVMFAGESVVAVFDFDFMSERPRIDDLALTAYFGLLEPRAAQRQDAGLPDVEERDWLAGAVSAYDASARIPLSSDELAALPLAIARQPAWSLGRWIRDLDEPRARAHAEAAAEEFEVAQAVLRDLPKWQDALLSH